MCSVSGSSSVNELNGFESVIVFPNPANDVLSVKGTPGKIDLSVYNVYGQPVMVEQVNRNNNFDVSGLSQGIYWVFLTNENHEVVKTKLVIEK